MPHGLGDVLDEHGFVVNMQIRAADSGIEDTDEHLAAGGSRLIDFFRPDIMDSVPAQCFHLHIAVLSQFTKTFHSL